MKTTKILENLLVTEFKSKTLQKPTTVRTLKTTDLCSFKL